MKLRRLEKLAIWAGVTYALCCGCKTSHSVELQQDTTLRETEHTQASGQEHEWPWTETVWEFGSGVRESNPSVRFGRPMPQPLGQPRPEVVPATGDLVKVTVRDYQGRDTSWQASSDGTRGAETRVALKEASASAPSTGCALGLGFGGVLAVAGLLAAGALYLRLRP